MGCTSIAFPLLASGNNGYDLELAFQIAKESIESFNGTKLKKAILVLFGNHVASIIKEHGYDIVEIPVDLKLQEKKQEKKEKAQKFVEEGKEIAQKFLEDQIQKGLDYLKDEEHREKILAAGIAVAKLAFKMVKKGK